MANLISTLRVGLRCASMSFKVASDAKGKSTTGVGVGTTATGGGTGGLVGLEAIGGGWTGAASIGGSEGLDAIGGGLIGVTPDGGLFCEIRSCGLTGA